MGTDIHGVFQRHDQSTNKWVDIPHNYEMHRHYQLFAVLAGVRNGTGFAGVKTGEAVTPISEPRGYPDDFVSEAMDDEGEQRDDLHPIASLEAMDPRRRKWHEAGEALVIWMGDHSHSWLTADEMLAWYATAPVVLKTGIFDREDYERWDKKSPPDFGYCGGIGGPRVLLVNDNKVERDSTPGWTHIRCEWQEGLREELAYFFDEVARLKAEHGNVRFVFGFDS
ncbi:MAG TPA: hypothetical protein VFM10_12865 [Terriglobales bacterium]|nr:hypothetical protein [Terriglobales bacterium]